MEIAIIGDTHGDIAMCELDQYLTRLGIQHVLQVGDAGLRWPGQPCKVRAFFEKRARQQRAGPIWHSCGGNHEPYHHEEYIDGKWELAPGFFIVQRGTVKNIAGLDVLFIGGAESSDTSMRIEWGHGRSQRQAYWWQRESLTIEELQVAEATVQRQNIDIVISHDAPREVRPWRIQRKNKYKVPTDRTSKFLSQLLSVMVYRQNLPTHWFYGHHHCHKSDWLHNVSFKCAGILDSSSRRPVHCGLILNTETKRVQSIDWKP